MLTLYNYVFRNASYPFFGIILLVFCCVLLSKYHTFLPLIVKVFFQHACFNFYALFSDW